MEILLNLPVEDDEVRKQALVVDFDPAQYPCGLLAQMWYELLSKNRG
jgi:hypothetical protein